MSFIDFSSWFGGGSSPKMKILALSDRLLGMAEWDAEHSRWHLCYLWRGMHGNYLIHVPRDLEQVKPVLTAKGGIKALFLPQSDESMRTTSEALFRFTGCYYISQSHHVNWQMPGYDFEEVYHHDFRIQRLADKQGWNIKAGKTELYIPLTLEAEISSRKNQIPCPLVYYGDNPSELVTLQFSIEQRLEELGLLNFLRKKRVLYFYAADLPLITLFDDIEFERNDYEVIAPSARHKIADLFRQSGGIIKRSEAFEWPKLTIEMVKSPSTLASHPLDPLNIRAGTLYLVTPTQYWLYLLSAAIPKSRKRDLAKSFAATLPFNWRKVKSETMQHYPEHSDISEIKSLQAACTAYFRSRRQRSIIGVPFSGQNHP